MNIDRIFGLLADNDGGADGGETIDTAFNIADLPEYKLKMCVKIIIQHKSYSKKVVGFFSRGSKELDPEELEYAGEFITYQRAWSYIKEVDVEKSSHEYAVEKASDLNLHTALKLAIHYFEELEEYEKCAHIFKIQKVCEKYLK